MPMITPTRRARHPSLRGRHQRQDAARVITAGLRAARPGGKFGPDRGRDRLDQTRLDRIRDSSMRLLRSEPTPDVAHPELGLPPGAETRERWSMRCETPRNWAWGSPSSPSAITRRKRRCRAGRSGRSNESASQRVSPTTTPDIRWSPRIRPHDAKPDRRAVRARSGAGHRTNAGRLWSRPDHNGTDEDFAEIMRRLFRGEVIIGHDGPAGKYPVLHLNAGLDEHLPMGISAFGLETLKLGAASSPGDSPHVLHRGDHALLCRDGQAGSDRCRPRSRRCAGLVVLRRRKR